MIVLDWLLDADAELESRMLQDPTLEDLDPSEDEWRRIHAHYAAFEAVVELWGTDPSDTPEPATAGLLDAALAAYAVEPERIRRGVLAFERVIDNAHRARYGIESGSTHRLQVWELLSESGDPPT